MDEILMINSGWYDSVYEPAVSKYHSMSGEQLESRIEQSIKVPSPEPILSMSDNLATIRIRGMLSRKGAGLFEKIFGIEVTSYGDIRSALSEADSKLPTGATIVLDIDSPGGTVAGAKETFDAILDVSSRREVVALNSGTVASAAMWIASASSRIIAANEMSIAGSIGVVVKAYIGNTDTVNITNTASTDKAPDLKTESGRSVMRELMDEVYGIFLSDLLTGRGGKTSAESVESLKGRVVLAKKAIDIGLMDGMQKKMNVDTSGADNNIGAGTENGDATTAATEENRMDEKLKEEIAAMISKAVEAKAQANTDPVAEHKALVASVSPYLSGSYSDEIRSMAIKALSGEVSVESLKAAVSAADAKSEAEKSAKAKEESGKLGATTATPPDSISADGVIETEAQYQALMAQYK